MIRGGARRWGPGKEWPRVVRQAFIRRNRLQRPTRSAGGDQSRRRVTSALLKPPRTGRWFWEWTTCFVLGARSEVQAGGAEQYCGADNQSRATSEVENSKTHKCGERLSFDRWNRPRQTEAERRATCPNPLSTELYPRIENLFLLEERPLPRCAFLIRAFALHYIAFDVALQD